jgi:hypothetical protein
LSIYGKGGGNLEYEANNYYYQDQTIVYEHGAIIVGQADGAAMTSEPAFSTKKYSLLNDTAIYGFMNPGTKENPNDVVYRFPGRHGNLTLTYYVYDVDASAEVLIKLNRQVIARAPVTGDKTWGGPYTLDLRGDIVNDFTPNRLEFNHTSIMGSDSEWGVRDVKIDGDDTHVTITMVSLIGNRDDISGRASHTLHVQLLAQELNSYRWPVENLTLSFTTKFQHGKTSLTIILTKLKPRWYGPAIVM